MSRKALRIKQQGLKTKLLRALASGKKPLRPTRVYNRCKLCGKIGGYIRRFEMCRICFRELASKGQMPGVRKSSW